MKHIALLIFPLLITGCAVAPRPADDQAELAPPRHYEAASASALAFDAPVFAGYELPGLDRAAREPGVFMGYEEMSVETFVTGAEDHQTPCGDYYDRYSFNTKMGTRYR